MSSHLSLVPDAVIVTEEKEGGALSLEEEVASPCLRRTIPHLQDAPSISPLIFMPCPKGPGRPKVGRQGAVSTKRKKDLRKRAEYSAGVENTLPFFDSGDICCICDFALNDPIKK